jgi:outer membrane protein TolC
MRPSDILFSLVIALSTVAGCATYRPSPIDPRQVLGQLERATPAVDPKVIRATLGSGGDSTFDLNDGLSEAELVAVAVSMNPELRAKRLEIDEVRPLTIEAGLWPNPEIGLTVRPGIGGASGTVVEADLLFELLRSGSRDANKRSAVARVDEVAAQVFATELDLASRVRLQLLATLFAEQAVEQEKTLLGRREQLLDLAQERKRVGEGTTLGVSAAELELAQGRRKLRSAETDAILARQALNRLAGLPPTYVLRLEASGKPLAVQVFDDVADEELDRRILSGRAELKSSLARYQQAEQQLRLAVIAQFPALRVGPSYGRELEGDSTLGLGLGIELPIFNRNQTRIAAATAQRDRRRHEYAATLHRLRADAYDARESLRRLRSEIETQEKELLPLVKRNQELYQAAFRSGELNIFNALEAEERALDARRDYLDLLRRYHEARIRLETATGLLLSLPVPPTQPTTRPL